MPWEVLQRVAEDLDRILAIGSDTRVTLESKLDSSGFPTARLEIVRTIFDAKNKPKVYEKIIWQSSYDYDSYADGLVLYRSHSGIAIEDKLLDQNKERWERELFIPFDSHVIRLLFTQFNGKRTNRLDLYDDSVNQSYLSYEIISTNPLKLKNNKLLNLQHNIRDDFDELEIGEPPIILDYLWYVGMIYCNNRLGNIGCKTCFLENECGTGR